MEEKNKNMTATEFQSLTEMEKLKILIRYGILIGELKEKHSRAFTYQVQSFFVEAKYTLETDDLISIESFSNFRGEHGSTWSHLHLMSHYSKNYPE
jgi:hypothetical protein